MKRLALAALASVTLSGTAFAADLAPRYAEPAAPAYLPYSWTGFYIGAQAGYTWGDSKFDGAGSPAGPPFVVTTADPRGAFGGIYAGYNFQMPSNIVVGAEFDANLSDAKRSVAFVGAVEKTDLKSFGSARLRLGYAWDRFLPYITGGVAYADYSGELVAPGISRKIDDTRIGWTLGAGLEYAFTDHLTARVEYRYSDYGRKSASGPFLFPGDPVRLSLKTSDVSIGIAYKF